jgi:hypothetical protein
MSLFQTNSLTEDVLDFLASTLSAEEVIAFQPSETVKQRSSYLLEQNRHDVLTDDEQNELDEFMRMNHFVDMLKIRARQKLTMS